MKDKSNEQNTMSCIELGISQMAGEFFFDENYIKSHGPHCNRMAPSYSVKHSIK